MLLDSEKTDHHLYHEIDVRYATVNLVYVTRITEKHLQKCRRTAIVRQTYGANIARNY